jgi:hypothetical protein
VKVGDDKVQELLSEKEIFEEEKKGKGLTTKCKLKNQEPEISLHSPVEHGSRYIQQNETLSCDPLGLI